MDEQLPDGVKSLDEIHAYPHIADQTVFLATHLEYFLRNLAGREGWGLTLEELLVDHGHKLTVSSSQLKEARWVRNQIIHATGKATRRQMLRGIATLEQAIFEIYGLTRGGPGDSVSSKNSALRLSGAAMA